MQDPQLSLRINKPSAARPKEQPVVARRQSQRTPRKRAFSSDEEHEADAVEPQKGSHWQAHTHRHGSERQPSRMANSSAADHREALQYTGMRLDKAIGHQ